MKNINALEIRSKLILSGTTGNDIAKQLGVSRQAVSQAIHGKSRSPQILQALANAIGEPVYGVEPGQEAA